MVGEKNKIKAIIFDLNEVIIIDSYGEAIDIIAENKKEPRQKFSDRIHNRDKKDNLWWKFCTGRINERQYWQELAKNIKNTRVLLNLRNKAYHLMIPKKKTVEIIKKLKVKYKLVLLTNHTKEWMNFLINNREGQEVINLFDIVINSADVSLKKPDRRIYEVAIQRINAKPEEILFIDDRDRNTRIAAKLGINTILYKSAYQLKKELKKYGVYPVK